MKKKFPILDIDDISTEEEINKLNEEVKEFIVAMENEDLENMIEEFYDVIQVMINLAYRYDVINDLEEGLNKHLRKINKRNWNIIKYI